jgi:hypothetical protein
MMGGCEPFEERLVTSPPTALERDRTKKIFGGEIEREFVLLRQLARPLFVLFAFIVCVLVFFLCDLFSPLHRHFSTSFLGGHFSAEQFSIDHLVVSLLTVHVLGSASSPLLCKHDQGLLARDFFILWKVSHATFVAS